MKRILLISLITLLTSCNNTGNKWKVIDKNAAINVIANIARNWRMPSKLSVKCKDNFIYRSDIKARISTPWFAYDVNECYAKIMNFSETPEEEYHIIRPSENDDSSYTLWNLFTETDAPQEGEEIKFDPGTKKKAIDLSKGTMISVFRTNLYAKTSNLELYPLTSFELLLNECEQAQGTCAFESKDNKSIKVHLIYTHENTSTYEFYGLYENYLPKEITCLVTDKNGNTKSSVGFVYDHKSKIVQDEINLDEWAEENL